MTLELKGVGHSLFEAILLKVRSIYFSLTLFTTWSYVLIFDLLESWYMAEPSFSNINKDRGVYPNLYFLSVVLIKKDSRPMKNVERPIGDPSLKIESFY